MGKRSAQRAKRAKSGGPALPDRDPMFGWETRREDRLIWSGATKSARPTEQNHERLSSRARQEPAGSQTDRKSRAAHSDAARSLARRRSGQRAPAQGSRDRGLHHGREPHGGTA